MEKVGFLTQTGGNRTNTEAMDTTTPGSRTMSEARVVVPTSMMDITKGTWAHTGTKGIAYPQDVQRHQ